MVRSATSTALHRRADRANAAQSGHSDTTPGSIGILANTATGPALLAGDAAWHRLQVEHLRQRPSYPGLFVDDGRDEAFRTLHRLHAIRNQMYIVPTHDHAAAARLRRYP